MRIKSVYLLIIIAVLVTSSLAFAEDIPSTIRIGVVGNAYGKPYGSGTIGVLHVKGLLEEEFKKDGIKVEYFFFKGTGPAINESIANNGVDFASYGDLPTIIGKAGGLKTKILAASGRGSNIFIAVPADDNNTKSIKDLVGKKVGVSKGTYLHLVFDRVLQREGLSEKDFKTYNLLTGDGNAALASKDIDAFVGTSDLIDRRKQGIARIIYSSKDEPENFKGTGAFVVTEEFAKKYPSIVKRVLKNYYVAAQWNSEEANRDATLKYYANAGTSYSTLKEEYDGASVKWRNDPLIDDFFVQLYKDTIAFSKEKGLIKKDINLNEWIDKSNQDQLLKELGLDNYWKDAKPKL
jgi:sulfonate transport system substrate-binding protein